MAGIQVARQPAAAVRRDSVHTIINDHYNQQDSEGWSHTDLLKQKKKPSIRMLLYYLKINVMLVIMHMMDTSNLIHPLMTLVFFLYIMGLCVGVCIAWIVMYIMSSSRAIKYMERLNPKLSMINWSTPNLYLEKDEFVEQCMKDAQNAMSEDAPETTDEPIAMNTNIAIALLLLSGVMYERDDAAMRRAVEEFVKGGRRPEDLEKLNACKHEFERRINKFAQLYGLEFNTMNELGRFNGPCCGVFWAKQRNFIVVAFKGTTPQEFNEWLVDASLQQRSGSSYLDGHVHRGFYRSLFGRSTVTTSWEETRFPYLSIARTVRRVCQTIAEQCPTSSNVNLYVTGHSLGAALASLFYARLVHAPEDMHIEKSTIRVRDAYVFGAPRVGNFSFAKDLYKRLRKPVNRRSRMWRVINGCDIVTRVPFGVLGDDAIDRLGKDNVFNYVHVGKCMTYKIPKRVLQDKEHPLYDVTATSMVDRMKNAMYFLYWIATADPDKTGLDEKEVIQMVEKAMPSWLVDHMPNRYFYAMKESLAN